MSAIGPGDFVECIRAGRRGVAKVGAVYLVTAVDPDGQTPCNYCDGCLGIDLHNLPNGDWGWRPACCFRPIYRPKSSLIEGLLKPADAPADLQGVDA